MTHSKIATTAPNGAHPTESTQKRRVEFFTGLKTIFAVDPGRTRRPRECIAVTDAQWAKMGECQRTLIAIKNAGWSYPMIAAGLSAELNNGRTISGALVGKVANGRCRSAIISEALGLAEELVTVPRSLVRLRPRNPNTRKRKRLSMEDKHGNLTETMDAICAAEGIKRPELQAEMLRNHLEFHGDLVDCDYRELEY